MNEPSGPAPAATVPEDTTVTSRALYGILTIYIALALTYSIVVPAFETPDEIWHFAFIQHVASGQGLPISEPNTQASWRQQGVQAPGYYLAAAALTSWIDQSDFPDVYERANPHRAIGQPDAMVNRNYLVHYESDDWPWQDSFLALHITRFLSILLGAVTLWASYRAVRPILGHRQALIGTSVFAFTPQFIFISAAASNDNAVNALAALVIWRLVLLVVEQPFSHPAPEPCNLSRDFLLIGVILGLAMLSKLSALGLVALTGVTVLYMALRDRSARPILQAILWIGVPAALISGWWYVRNYLLYQDFLAWNIWQQNILLRVDTASWSTIFSELTSLERSYWGLFGWLNIGYPDAVYLFFRAVSVLILAGLAIATVRGLLRSREWNERWIAGGLLILWLLVLTVSWLRFMRIAPAAQGRYFFPAAPSLVMVIAIGMNAYRFRLIGWLVAVALFVLSLVTPFWIIAPAYQPSIHMRLQQPLHEANIQFGNTFTLLGVDAVPSALEPGDQATVVLKLRNDQSVATDYSVFVHLVDDDDLIVAQQDSMPGGGLAPTSQWSQGQTRLDTYTVTIPTTAYTPNRAHWRIGLYDAATGERLPVNAPEDKPSQNHVQPLSDSVRFGQVDILSPPGTLPNPLDVTFQDNISLAGYELNHRRLRPGDELQATLYWRADGQVDGEYVAFVHLLDAEYSMHGGQDETVLPTLTEWPVAEIYTDTYEFTVPPSASPGQYQLEIGLYTISGNDRLLLKDASGAEGADRLLLGPLQVVEP